VVREKKGDSPKMGGEGVPSGRGKQTLSPEQRGERTGALNNNTLWGRTMRRKSGKSSKGKGTKGKGETVEKGVGRQRKTVAFAEGEKNQNRHCVMEKEDEKKRDGRFCLQGGEKALCGSGQCTNGKESTRKGDLQVCC